MVSAWGDVPVSGNILLNAALANTGTLRMFLFFYLAMLSKVQKLKSTGKGQNKVLKTEMEPSCLNFIYAILTLQSALD